LGMQMLNEELVRLVVEGVVDAGEAYTKAADKIELAKLYEVNDVEFEVPSGLDSQ